MKTPGRILMILAVCAFVMGITYLLVNAGTSGNSTNAVGFGRVEFRGEHGGGWMFGAIKNTGIVSIIVVSIVLPKGWLRKRKLAVQLAGE
jgi:hypothetical protein